MLLVCAIIGAVLSVLGIVINGGPCGCCNPYYYYSYYAAFYSGGPFGPPFVQTGCCENLLPSILYATVNVDGTWCDGSGIDGAVIPIVWNGTNAYYGTTTTTCEKCDTFEVILECFVDVWNLSFNFISTTAETCLNPTPPAIPACEGSQVSFDCDTYTASRTEFFNGVDVLSDPHCCDNVDPDPCESITVTVTP